MNAPHSPSLLTTVPMAPADPILGVTEMYAKDTNPKKVNLGVGVYYDENGKVPLLECVRRAEQAHLQKGAPHGYLPIDGLQAYDRAVMQLLFGADSATITTSRRSISDLVADRRICSMCSLIELSFSMYRSRAGTYASGW